MALLQAMVENGFGISISLSTVIEEGPECITRSILLAGSFSMVGCFLREL